MFSVSIDFTNGETRKYDQATIKDIRPDWVEKSGFNGIPDSEGDRIIVPMHAIKVMREHETLYQPKRTY